MTKILFVCHGNICRSPMAEFDGAVVNRFSDVHSGFSFPAQVRLFFYSLLCGLKLPTSKPSVMEEYEEAVRNLERVSWRVNCVLTHCAPTSIQQKLDQNYTPDRLTDFLQRGCRPGYRGRQRRPW